MEKQAIKPSVLWFSEVSKNDNAKVGGKGANLGELARAGFPVPNGFIVTADAYYYFLQQTKLAPAIEKTLRNINPEDSKKLNAVSKVIKTYILKAAMPPI